MGWEHDQRLDKDTVVHHVQQCAEYLASYHKAASLMERLGFADKDAEAHALTCIAFNIARRAFSYGEACLRLGHHPTQADFRKLRDERKREDKEEPTPQLSAAEEFADKVRHTPPPEGVQAFGVDEVLAAIEALLKGES
jgi:hypothetical protein